MPRRIDVKKVLVIGSGPIVIGQACEFDYSGTQAIQALREEGVEVVLLNSNPATVMTDPDLAHRTYIEPITPEVAERIIARERPDALLPTMGGQTALNLAKALAESGVLARYGVRLIGASLEAINKAEDRELFKAAMERIGLACPKSGAARSLEQAHAILATVGFPAILRPSFTLGGTGGGVAHDLAEFDLLCAAGLAASPTGTVLVEQSVLGWKEFELEVIRDSADNAIIVCSIENFDPMGVHTGDSITVAPAQTLTDREYQQMREAALAIIREIGVETGGANVQFGVNPRDGRMVVIEMNPRVSRSSALASKATGYPIARVATKLALGYTLPELKNDITRTTTACFEPALDYVVVKIPRFDFEKFPGAEPVLTTSMRSVGEAMAIGRTFSEAFLKALRSMDLDPLAFVRPLELPAAGAARLAFLEDRLRVPRPDRPLYLAQAFREGLSVDEVHRLSAIDPWFLRHLRAIVQRALAIASAHRLRPFTAAELREAKRTGFSDAQLGFLTGQDEAALRATRHRLGIRPVYKRVDTCAGEFEAHTPYLYSAYEQEDEAPPSARAKVLILGSGPNRIGQGIEFDYCCVHAALALREAGFETVMLNCNPETVSTDFNVSDRLYFEPITLEDVLEVAAREKPLGVIVQLGGQTPLKLALALEQAGVPILGTSPEAIDRAEDRERFSEVVRALGLQQPENGVARSASEALAVAGRIGYPVMVRPSYVLGGRAMEVVWDPASLERYVRVAVPASNERPVLIDRYLENAIEADLDLVADCEGAVQIGGILEHVEEAGVHSGDAACVLPPHSLPPDVQERMKDQAAALARALGVRGLMNVQFAAQGKALYVLEVNPRASRTVPFVAKATGVPLARIAALCMAGKTLRELGVVAEVKLSHVAVKEAVFPFARFPGVDVLLGPEMRSTGEVMGLADTLPMAFAKSQLAAGLQLPAKGTAFFSVKDADKPAIVDLARRLTRLGFELVATTGTRGYLAGKWVACGQARKITESAEPAGSEAASANIVEQIAAGRIAMVINTVEGAQAIEDSRSLRRAALQRGVPYFTSVQAARLAVAGIEALGASGGVGELAPLQERLRTQGTAGSSTRKVAS